MSSLLADLIRDDGTPGAGQITFVVRNDDRASPILFQTDDETEQAYNDWVGDSANIEQSGPGVTVRVIR